MMNSLSPLSDDAVIVDGPMRGRQSGKLKYRFIVLENGHLGTSDYRYLTEENARKAGEKYLGK